MSKRSERREADRTTRKLAFQQLRQQPPQTATLGATPAPSDEQQTTSDSAVSEAQLAANRANAQHSTGPVSTEGKARSAANALKTGLTGKTILIPSESAADYESQLFSYVARYQPATDEELNIVQSILECSWRLNRIQRLESAVLLKGHIEFAAKYADRSPLERASLIEAEAYIKYEKTIRNLNIQEARLRRTMEKAKKELTALQFARRQKDKSTPQPQTATAPNQNGFEFSNQTDQATPTHPIGRRAA